MKVIRKIRLMSPKEMLELLPYDGSGIDAEMTMTAENLPPDIFEKEIAAGNWKAIIITNNGERFYKVVWQFNAGIMSIIAAISIHPGGDDINVLGAGIDKLARAWGCTKIHFSTRRKSLVLQCEKWGARVTSVSMIKDL